MSAFLGVCVAVVAFFGLTGATLAWTLGVLGALILVLGLWSSGTWQDYASAFLGLCVVAVAFLGLADGALVWTLVILGAAILALDLWGSIETSSVIEGRHA